MMVEFLKKVALIFLTALCIIGFLGMPVGILVMIWISKTIGFKVFVTGVIIAYMSYVCICTCEE